MNFLAHLYLSDNRPKVMVGNFIGDFVKGAQLNTYEDEIQAGIRMHREIDKFTDTHPVVMTSKERLRPKFRHYSPVIVDVFYDHFLARDWEQFSPVPLEQFTLDFYQMMTQFKNAVPQSVNHMLQYMEKDNWLYHYQQTDNIHRALSGMARRTKFPSKMELATQSLLDDYEPFSQEFHRFFPDLQQYCSKYLKNNA